MCAALRAEIDADALTGCPARMCAPGVRAGGTGCSQPAGGCREPGAIPPDEADTDEMRACREVVHRWVWDLAESAE